MTQRRLEQLCRLWQRRLRLQDWAVTVRFKRPGEEPDAIGLCWPEPSTRSAEIAVQDDTVLEATLIHELLHLRLLPFGQYFKNQRETAMNLIAASFQEAYKRRGRKS